MVITDLNLRDFCLDCDKHYTNIESNWCKICNSKWFQQDFLNWTSKNEFIDKYIQETQLNTQYSSDVLEWIPYNEFENIESISEGTSNILYKATWLNGPIKKWSDNKNKWIRDNNKIVILKNFNVNNLSSLSEDFLNKVCLIYCILLVCK